MLLHMSKKEKRKSKLLVQVAQKEPERKFRILLLEEDLQGMLKRKLQVNLRVHQNQAVLDVRLVGMVARS